uniref:Rho-GAP domain-containing protein n=1 Tax=Biomphalaria glabrata TaxID=6526 RepID=A0A2C9JIA3_BIOGL
LPFSQTKENRRLVKSSFLVELVNGVRKLRFMFLFNDILICTKRVPHRNNKVTFDIKWFTPLNQMTYDTKFGYRDAIHNSSRKKAENAMVPDDYILTATITKFIHCDSYLKNYHLAVSTVHRCCSESEQFLFLAKYKHSLEASSQGSMPVISKEDIATIFSNIEDIYDIHNEFVQSLTPKVQKWTHSEAIGDIFKIMFNEYEDILTGTLNVTIHKLNGLTEDCDTYCCLEMDSFGHFFMKAKTHIRHATRDPAWNEDFELELEGSQTIRFLCFKKEDGDHGDKLLGRGALELSRHWLKSSFQEKTVVMNEISLVISVRHTAADKTMSRTPSRTSSAVFGVKISTCARREGKTVPSLVTACLQEVEKRGLDEVGIYRVSGVTSDLQRIKKLFDKNVRAGIAALEDADIHTVTGTLKLYLRELPEPLFTEANYQNFIDTLSKSPLDSYFRVARNVSSNKMSVHNLATVFGPTLLAPAVKQDTTDPMELMFKGAEEVMHQSSVINYLLGIAISGRSLRKSAQ